VFATKTRACKGASHEWSMEVTFHAPESVRECEGMNPHTPTWTPILKVGVWWTFEFSKGDVKGQNSLNWKIPYIIEKFLEHRC
jgi:hypothetical protein